MNVVFRGFSCIFLLIFILPFFNKLILIFSFLGCRWHLDFFCNFGKNISTLILLRSSPTDERIVKEALIKKIHLPLFYHTVFSPASPISTRPLPCLPCHASSVSHDCATFACCAACHETLTVIWTLTSTL